MNTRPITIYARLQLSEQEAERCKRYAVVDRFTTWGMDEPHLPMMAVFISAVAMYWALTLCHQLVRLDDNLTRRWLAFIDWFNFTDLDAFDLFMARFTQIFSTFAVVISVVIVILALIVMTGCAAAPPEKLYDCEPYIHMQNGSADVELKPIQECSIGVYPPYEPSEMPEPQPGDPKHPTGGDR